MCSCTREEGFLTTLSDCGACSADAVAATWVGAGDVSIQTHTSLIQLFDEQRGRVTSLAPTASAPSTLQPRTQCHLPSIQLARLCRQGPLSPMPQCGRLPLFSGRFWGLHTFLSSVYTVCLLPRQCPGSSFSPQQSADTLEDHSPVGVMARALRTPLVAIRRLNVVVVSSVRCNSRNCTVLYYDERYCTVPYSTVLYSIFLFCQVL